MKCKTNEGKLDRIIRFILSLIFFLWGVAATGTLRVILYIIALILLITAISGFCAFYSLLKINTDKDKNSDSKDEIKTAKVVEEPAEAETSEGGHTEAETSEEMPKEEESEKEAISTPEESSNQEQNQVNQV